jgi:hypothetical protein
VGAEPAALFRLLPTPNLGALVSAGAAGKSHDFAIQYVERREQSSPAMSLVVVRLAFRHPAGRSRIGAVRPAPESKDVIAAVSGSIA